jgi:predicted permease
MFQDLERVQTVFTGIAAHCHFAANLAARGITVHTDGLLVSGSYFPVLGVRAALGRLLGPDDDHIIGEPHVVVLSYEYWKIRFGQDPGVLNQVLIINGQAMTIVGVVQRGFDGTTVGLKPQIFAPITMWGVMSPGSPALDNRRSYWVFLFARLKPGVTLEQARASLNVQYHALINEVEAPLNRGLSKQLITQFRAKPIVLQEGSRGQNSVSSGETRTWLNMLLGITAFVLLIACANVANLLLARGTARAAETALRLSIGATRMQVALQLFLESCLLALFAGCAGILVAQWTLDFVALLFPMERLKIFQSSLNVPTLLFSAMLALGTTLIFGLYPALHSTRMDLMPPLKGQGGQLSGAKSATRYRTALASAQIAISLALLVAAGLFARSLINVSREDLGVKMGNVITFRISPSLNGYTHQRSFQLYERVEDELASLPGVTGVSDSDISLLSGDSNRSSVIVEDYKPDPGTTPDSLFQKIGSAYFSTFGIPLISGREFVRSDTAGSREVVIVNEAFANKFNLGRGAVGKHIGTGPNLDMEIVGLVQNSKYREVKEAVQPQFYYPYRQDDRTEHLSFYVRTSLDPDQFLPSVNKVMAQLDPTLPVENLCTMPQQVRESIFVDRFISILSAAFASLATLLAAVGLYGVVAYAVTERTREIGLRIALGASKAQVRAMVIRQVARITLVGAAAGLVLASALGHMAQSLLYQLRGTDPAIFCGSTIALALVALVAGYIPARRASRLDPMQALRYE